MCHFSRGASGTLKIGHISTAKVSVSTQKPPFQKIEIGKPATEPCSQLKRTNPTESQEARGEDWRVTAKGCQTESNTLEF